MRKLYQQHKLAFALVWIGIYVTSLSIADGLSSSIGIEKLITAPLCVCLCFFLVYLINTMHLQLHVGLVRTQYSAKNMLYYIPLLLIVSTNLWSGIQLNFSIFESILFVISMICVGFLEEVIFRGFLFKALYSDNLNQAIIISSVTFGIGHIINLLSGAELISTLLQMIYATCAGFLFTIIFLKTSSLIPCILTHSALNALSCFSAEQSVFLKYAAPVFLMIVPLVYAYWIIHLDQRP